MHVLAARYGIGAVGNIYTRPAARGRGYSGAAAAVVAELLAGPCREVILNVAAANTAAIRLYRRLGFREHCRYWEGRAVRAVERGAKRAKTSWMVSRSPPPGAGTFLSAATSHL